MINDLGMFGNINIGIYIYIYIIFFSMLSGTFWEKMQQ
jgi:hypothetical protein